MAGRRVESSPSNKKPGFDAGLEMVRAAGFEPADDSSEGIDCDWLSDPVAFEYTQICAQISDENRRLLARVVENWPQLNGG